MSANDPLLGWIGLSVATAVVVVLFVVHVQSRTQAPSQVIVEERRSKNVPSLARQFFLTTGYSCTPSRYQLAFDRWAAAGWPSLEFVDFPLQTAVHVIEPSVLLEAADDPHHLRGGVGYMCHDDAFKKETCNLVMATRKRSCGDDDYTLEHEVGHAAYSLDHVSWPSGWVMNEYHSQIGGRIPSPPGGLWP